MQRLIYYNKDKSSSRNSGLYYITGSSDESDGYVIASDDDDADRIKSELGLQKSENENTHKKNRRVENGVSRFRETCNLRHVYVNRVVLNN